jgi:hypothetical protein
MRLALALALLLAAAARPAPAPRPPDDSKVVKRVTLPAGAVKWENVKTPRGVVVRVTAGKVVVEGKRLFYGDGKVATEIVATEKGMLFVHYRGGTGPSASTGPDSYGVETVLGGTYTHGPGATWYVEPDAPTADKLKPGSVYVITPSIKFARNPPRILRLRR